MELTHSNKHNVAATHTWLRQPLTKFVNRHAAVFEALARTATPFGGNWLSSKKPQQRANGPETTREQLQDLQQQLEVLTKTVAQLSNQIDAQSAQLQTTKQPTHLGINRFRALQANS